MIGKPQGVTFVRLEQACLSLLDMHEVHGDIEFLEELDQTLMVVARDLQHDVHLGQRNEFVDALHQRAKPLTRLREAQGWAAFKPLVAREQGGRDEACTMLRLANIDTNIERFMQEQGNRLESGRGGSFAGHTPPLSVREEALFLTGPVYCTAGLGQGLCTFAALPLREPLTAARAVSVNDQCEKEAQNTRRREKRGRSRTPWACLSQLHTKSCLQPYIRCTGMPLSFL